MNDEIQEILKIPDLPVIEIVDDLVQVYKEFMVVRAALQLDLFSWLEKNGPATPADMATGTGVKAEYMTALLGMLYYLDIVRKTDDTFSISPAARLNFVRSSPFYQGDYIMNLPALDSPWQDLAIFLTRPDEKKTFDSSSPGSIRSDANHSLRGTVQSVTNVLKTWDGFSGAKRLLEMNGGHALYAIAACQNNPELNATVLCKAEDSSIADNYISRFGMKKRIVVENGDILSYSGNECDIVLIAHTLYSYQGRLDEVISKVASYLSSGGLFLSNHWFTRDPGGTGMQGLYELELALHNQYHELPDKETFEALCMKNGLPILQEGVIRSPYGESSIHIAEMRR